MSDKRHADEIHFKSTRLSADRPEVPLDCPYGLSLENEPLHCSARQGVVVWTIAAAGAGAGR